MLCNLVRINRRIALKSVSIASSIYKVLIQWTPERTVFATGGGATSGTQLYRVSDFHLWI